MRSEAHLAGADWSHDSDRDSVTEIYDRPPEHVPAIPRGTPRFTPSVRSFEIAARDERLTIPTLPTPARWPERTNGTRRDPSLPVKIAFGIGCILVGVAIGAAIALGGSSGTRAKPVPAQSPAPATIVAPTPRPIVVPAAPIAPQPKPRVTVRIETEPAGATALLVDDGKTSFLGTTPIDTDVEPTRSYEVVLTLEDRAPTIARFDPARGNRVHVVLAPAP